MSRIARRKIWLLFALVAFPLPRGWAGEPETGGTASRIGTRRALLFCGLPGDDEHRALYAGAIEKIYKALTERLGFSAPDVFVRFGTESKPGDGPGLSGARGLGTREGLEADVAELTRRVSPDDTVWVIVLGHGHFDGRHSHLNLPGPDVSDVAFGKLFSGLKAKDVIFMVTTSASGFFLKPLAAPERIVITATEPDQEVNETLFPLALADALAEPPSDADRDKDGTLSVLELYLAVVNDVMKRYVNEENLPTEHARLDDNGDGHGSEIQLNYLSAELGGRVRKGNSKPPSYSGKDDGARASKTRVEPNGEKKP